MKYPDKVINHPFVEACFNLPYMADLVKGTSYLPLLIVLPQFKTDYATPELVKAVLRYTTEHTDTLGCWLVEWVIRYSVISHTVEFRDTPFNNWFINNMPDDYDSKARYTIEGVELDAYDSSLYIGLLEDYWIQSGYKITGTMSELLQIQDEVQITIRVPYSISHCIAQAEKNLCISIYNAFNDIK